MLSEGDEVWEGHVAEEALVREGGGGGRGGGGNGILGSGGLQNKTSTCIYNTNQRSKVKDRLRVREGKAGHKGKT